ncbi:hypothetical protein BCR35DRAFT_301769 [Leucosporidium creatinivorum]|uniref:Arrestin-like N-terminal domain-containing protein n=1 Tax=Leucosporidium creatinivorum TaxID=106004 RepID=A0A1Y2G038_9BASI|nr:hypothetical protein BCR35DRAFT_301769 [Leucosporidium creatinivorum]
MAPKLQKSLPPAVFSADLRSGTLPASPSFKNHGKLSLSLLLQREEHLPWLAGETVRGWLEVGVSSNELWLGEVGVELCGFEELRSRDHTSTRRLLTSRVDFQGGSLPPSNAVVQNAQARAGYYPALRGKTRFPFAFKLPKEVPSSCSLGSNATTRYELRAFASSILGEEVEVRSEKKAIRVVERWGDWAGERVGEEDEEDVSEWAKGCEKRAAERLRFAGDGQLGLTVAVGKDEWSETPLRLYWRGEREMGWCGKGRVEVRARVKNASQKHVSGLKFSLVRRLRIIYPKGQQPVVAPPAITATIVSQNFHGAGFEFPAGEEREVILHIDLPPRDECWTKRKGVLFELDVLARVEVDCGFLSKDLAVEIPVYVAHPTSLPPAAHEHIANQLQSVEPLPAFPSLPAFPGSPSAPATYLNPYAPSSVDSYADFAPHGMYSPATTATNSSVGQGHSMSSSSSHGAPLYHRPSVSVAAASPNPYFAPPPSAPAELAYGQQPQQYIAFDPNAPDLTQSHFLQSLQHQQPAQAYVPPNSSMSIGLGTPSPASTRSNSPNGAEQTMQYGQGHAVTFAPPPPPPPILSPPPPGSAASQSFAPEPPAVSTMASSTSSPVAYTPYTLQHSAFPPPQSTSPAPMSPSDFAHYTSNVGPIEGYSASTRARGRIESSPPAVYHPHEQQQQQVVPPPPSPSPAPMQRSHSASPSAGASRFTASPLQSPSMGGAAGPVEGFVGMGGGDPGLLETIGEDGESQAGTARSVQAALVEALKGVEEGNEDPHALARQMEQHQDTVQSPTAKSRPVFASRTSAQDLEDLVAEAEQEREKTLPSPPVPSARTKPSTPTPRAQDVFSPSTDTVAPIPSRSLSKSPSKLPLPPRSEGGLSALEARLSRPSTPDLSSLSRSPSPTKPAVTSCALSSTSSQSNEGRSLSPVKRESMAVPAGGLLARSLSRASSMRQMREQKEKERSEEDGRRAAEKGRRAEEDRKRATEEQAAVAATTKEDAEAVTAFAKPTTTRPVFTSKRKAVPLFDAPATTTPSSTASPVSAPTEAPFVPPSSTSASTPLRLSPSPSLPDAEAVNDPAPSTSPLTSPTILNGRKVVDVAEVKGLKKEAVGRIADWLKSDESAAGSHQEGEKATRRRTTDLSFARLAPSPPSEVAEVGGLRAAPLRSTPMSSSPSPWSARRTPISRNGAVSPSKDVATPLPSSTSLASLPSVSPAPSPPVSAPRRTHKSTQSLPVNIVKPKPSAEPTMAELLAEEERSGAGSMSSSSSLSDVRRAFGRSGLSASPSWKTVGEDGEKKYDVRSARGGQGGIVASRADRWKEMIEGEERDRNKSPPPPISPPKALKLKTTPFDAPSSRPLSPINNLRSARSPSPANSPIAAKRSSATSSPAPTFLNTTMGKPAVLSGAVRAVPSTVMRGSASSPALGSSSSAGGAGSPSGGGGGGGRMVKELLERYTSQVEAHKVRG